MKRTNVKFWSKALVLVSLVCLAVAFASCANAAKDNGGGETSTVSATEEKLLGKWIETGTAGFTLKKDNTMVRWSGGFEVPGGKETWSADGTKLTLKYPVGPADNKTADEEVCTYTLSADGQTLTLKLDADILGAFGATGDGREYKKQ